MKRLLLISILLYGFTVNAQNIVITPTTAPLGYASTTGGSFTNLKFYYGNWKDSLGYYLLKTDTNGLARKSELIKYLPKSDTASMLSNYVNKYSISDYLLKSDTSVFARKTALGGYVLKSDTSTMLNPYAKNITLNSYLKLVDTTAMLAPYAKINNQNAANILLSRNYTYESKPHFLLMTKDSTTAIYKTTVDSLIVKWTQVSNKPSFFSGAYNDLTGKPTLFDGNYNSLTNKPAIPSAQVNSDWDAVSGISQILNKPSIKRVETYRGTTSTIGGNVGRYSVTYSTPFSTVPLVLPSIQANSDYMQQFRIVSSTTSGFVIECGVRTGLTVLAVTVLSSAVTPTNGVAIDVVVVGQ